MLETANARAMTAYATHVVTGQAAENHERTDIAQVANDAVALIGSLRACEPQNRGAFIRCGRGAGRSATSLLVVSDGKRMARQPKYAGNIRRIDADVFPPYDLVTAVMNFAVMTPAQRYGEFIAHFPPERTALREAEVVSVRWSPTADQTSMCGDKLHMIPVTNPPRFGQRSGRSCRSIGSARVAWALVSSWPFASPGCTSFGVRSAAASFFNRTSKASSTRKLRPRSVCSFHGGRCCPKRGVISRGRDYRQSAISRSRNAAEASAPGICSGHLVLGIAASRCPVGYLWIAAIQRASAVGVLGPNPPTRSRACWGDKIRSIEVILAGNADECKERIAARISQRSSHPMRSSRLSNGADRPVRGNPFTRTHAPALWLDLRCLQPDRWTSSAW